MRLSPTVPSFVVPLLALPLLGGCVVGAVAGTAATVVTAPVKATAWTVDRLTTSQAEADRNYGRKMREAEAREGRERHAWSKHCSGHPERDGCDGYRGFVAANGR